MRLNSYYAMTLYSMPGPGPGIVCLGAGLDGRPADADLTGSQHTHTAHKLTHPTQTFEITAHTHRPQAHTPHTDQVLTMTQHTGNDNGLVSQDRRPEGYTWVEGISS